ncbi:hypothetical protein OSH11_11365 [Kaistia dalseonensis]|uniref:Uncharacterized protein n=1 Tax=Kaistia dalseonensis TaxID=410840 RepID=A0ABU0H8R3_9HYPH|nr:hypothetical protein [Kaistia dalseonensis]MCX5495308.1 hypothetical protein [Kaistia dalseonensis]MDQ0437894.1 hypothetical protein [Kaistia dalseonensis]
MLFPRFRSKERDLRGDIERFASIDSAVARAITEAEQELAGLTTRLDEARSRAAFLYGDVIDSEDDIDERSTTLIQEAERFLVRGEKRRGELAEHLAMLGAIRDQVQLATDAVRADMASE